METAAAAAAAAADADAGGDDDDDVEFVREESLEERNARGTRQSCTLCTEATRVGRAQLRKVSQRHIHSW